MKTRTFPFIFSFVTMIIGLLSFCPVTHAALPFSYDVDYALDTQSEQPRSVAVIWITPQSGYYAYAHHGDSAKPAELVLRATTGVTPPLTVLYPVGRMRQDFFEPDKTISAYEGRFPIFVRFDAGTTTRFIANLSLLLCSRQNCIPVQQEISLDIPDRLTPLADVSWQEAYRAALPGRAPVQDFSSSETDSSRIPVIPPTGSFSASTQKPLPVSNLIPLSEKHISVSSEPKEHQEWTFTPRFPQQALEPTALGTAMLLGLLAGLILNVMPCVLPVLTMKISGLLSASGHTDERSRLKHFREHNLLFAAGILTWFIVLAVTVGSMGLAWGGLFQNVGLVYGLLLLVFLLSLSLFDVFTLPILDFKVGASGNPRTQAYLAGLVATLLATPCSGPLLGGVLGWAALQPLPVVMAVFTATGIGMSTPYLVLAAWPRAARILPKPGAWTGIMERLVGFFLMGTAIYLLSILPETQRLSALVTLLIAALAAWIWGQWGGLRASGRQKAFTGTLAVLMVAGAIWWSVQPPAVAAPWQPFSASSFRAVLAKQPLLVEFTADWCPSCKVLERTVLTPERLRSAIDRYGVRLIKVDLTRPDPEAQALLRSLGSVSIPVTAVFPQGTLSDSPLVLRDLYTPGQLEDVLKTLPIVQREQ